MKRHLYILIAVISLALGILGSVVSLKLSLAAAAVILLIFALLSDFKRVTYLVALYLFIDFVFRQLLPGNILSGYWDELFLILAAAVWLYKWFTYKKGICYRWTPLELPLIFFILTGILLFIVNSPDMRISLDGLRAVVQYMLWFFLTVQLLKTSANAKNVVLILVFAGAFLAVHGILQYIIGVEIPQNWLDQAEKGVRTRAFSIVGSPNILGSLMVLLAPISVSLALSEKQSYKKLLYGAISSAMFLCLLLTFSRGALLSFFAAMFIFLFIMDKRFVIPFAIFAVMVVVFVPSVADRVAYMLSMDYVESSLRGGRLNRLFIGLDKLKESPWLGVGLGHFGGAVAANNQITDTIYLDNYFLKTAVEMGIVGLASFCILIYNTLIWSYRTLVKLKGTSTGLLVQGAFAGLCGVVIHNLGENVFEVPMMVTYFWVIAGIIMFFRHEVSKTGQNTMET